MKSGTLTRITILVLLASAASLPAAAQKTYRIVVLSRLGGTAAGGNSINNRGWLTGNANLQGDQVTHAALWVSGSQPVDLGTLGGPNSAVAWPLKNDNGVIAGISETAQINPLGERFSCPGFFGTPLTGHSCQGFRWQDGAMTALPTLGGYDSYATGANNRGDVVGWAENTVHDPSCNTKRQALQFRAVMWTPKGELQELPPFSGDSTSAATAINDEGQVVGISGTCFNAVGSFSARHALIWENGLPRDIGNFGGAAWNTPTAINNQGVVAGFSDFAGDGNGVPNFHAFLWTGSGSLQDLGTVGTDPYSAAFGLNDKGQVVGQSYDANFNSRAFLYENGKMMDLNALVPNGSPFLIYANDINSRGEIAGQACDPDQCAAGQTFAFLAIPINDGVQNSASDSQGDAGAARKMLPESVRRQFQQRFGIEFGDDQ